MIQGYAIYLRTHRETGKQYAGAVWGSNLSWVAESACARRWRYEDRKGIRGLHAFDSVIVYQERRADAPPCSDGMYHIRIAVDEAAAIDAIPPHQQLNHVSPLLQLHLSSLSEEVLRIGGERKARGGYASGVLHVKLKLGIFAPDYDKTAPGKIGGVRTHLLHPNQAKEAGLKNVANGHLSRIRRFAAHRRWHVARNITNLACRLCVEH